MKPEKWVFWFIFIFFLIVTPVYWVMSHEIAGTFVLGFAGLLGGMIAGYLALTARSFDPRPEDRPDAEVVEAAGDVGFFAPSSMWPFWCAVTLAVIALGPALHQAWISIIGIVIGVWACSGWLLQFYRGDYKH
ncbi:Cytochrome c oxidase subunit IV [Tessaracoccus bendigoensis DSM 12906]|uniref:Cytochrome c oxidase polypeptide 4 n=1 Tax=Tessaracoccus bendigoensis DSM 12906 TaxID=1123357 RepID=A0A1M6AV37_9ACTN|nr:cytochrome c oxidase subunit 4 [Tessaracoccus bendigoensis]SHI40281.1 Cytochrome c oxidase subunit IV [Tessaracoccus bendigoensis DSM 12906]